MAEPLRRDADREPPTDPGAISTKATDREQRRAGRGYRSMGRAMPLRFGVTLAAMVYSVVAPKLGVEPAVVMTVLGLAGAFMGFDTARPSGMVRE